MTDLHFEVLRTTEELVALRPQWEALWLRSPGAYYLSFASCLESWRTTHQPLGRALRCAVLREGDVVRAILPMVGQRKGLWTVARSLGPEAAEGCDILMGRDDAPTWGALIFERFIAAVRPDILDLPFVTADSPLDVAIRASGRYHVALSERAMPYAVLSEATDWPTFEKGLSRSYQQQTGRKRRRLQEQGAVEIEIIRGAADAAIDWLLDEKAKWGTKVDKRGPWLFSPRYRAYLKAFAASGSEVLTFVLRLDGAPCAVKVIAAGPVLCTLIIAAYDERYSQFSPGSILDEVWVRHVFETYRDERGRRLDINFGVGTERYKTHWARGHAFAARTYKVAGTVWGEVPYRAKALLASSRRRARAALGTPASTKADAGLVRAR